MVWELFYDCNKMELTLDRAVWGKPVVQGVCLSA